MAEKKKGMPYIKSKWGVTGGPHYPAMPVEDYDREVFMNVGLPQLAEKEEIEPEDVELIKKRLGEFDKYYKAGWKDSAHRGRLAEIIDGFDGARFVHGLQKGLDADDERSWGPKYDEEGNLNPAYKRRKSSPTPKPKSDKLPF